MRIVSIFLATLVLIFSLSACQIVNEEELATIREEGYQQGKESAERDSASALSAQYDAGHEEGYQAGYQKGREDGLKEAAQKAKADKAKEESKPQPAQQHLPAGTAQPPVRGRRPPQYM